MKFNKLKWPIFISLFIIAVSCNERYRNAESTGDLAYTTEKAASDGLAEPAANGFTRQDIENQEYPDPLEELNLKIIKNARIEADVKNASAAAYELESKLMAMGGYVANSEIKETGRYILSEMQLRLPGKNFSKMIEQMGKIAEDVTYKKVWTQDVTEEFIDIETRLKNKKEVEARYIDILRSKANTVEEVLETEEKLRVLREEIEAREGRLRYLQNQVSFSTISVVLRQEIEQEEVEEEPEETFWTELAASLGNGWNAILSILLFLANIWPLLLIAIVAYIFLRKKVKNFLKN